jgi:L-gulonolactone oxidase
MPVYGGSLLTGLILWTTIQLKPVESSFIDLTTEPFSHIQDFFELSHSYDEKSEYTVSWLDLTARGKNLGRGIFMAGNHSKNTTALAVFGENAKVTVRFPTPSFVLNSFTIQKFNQGYFKRHGRAIEEKGVNYDSFFYPLDAVGYWNRLYGKRGLFQYQCVIPPKDSLENMRTILSTIGESGETPFLSVFKSFGNTASPGLLSFPQEGHTLAFDLPNRGQRTLALMDALDQLVAKMDGRVYPAKDARMGAAHFKQFFPAWKEMEKFRDPQFSSNFWRRVTQS